MGHISPTRRRNRSTGRASNIREVEEVDGDDVLGAGDEGAEEAGREGG